MHRQSELAKNIRRLFIRRARFKTLLHSPKSFAQGQSFLAVTQFAQQLSDAFGPLPRRANQSQCRRRFHAASLNTFQKRAFELAAILRTLRVNSAATTIVRRAWLGKTRLTALFFQRQTKRCQPRCFIARLQLHIGKNHAVAAQPASETKFFRN